MTRISLFSGVLVLAVGASLAASPAFAMGCLYNQDQLPTLSLSNDTMVPNKGFRYDKNAYDAALAKGNSCAVTQQSQPIDGAPTGAGVKTAPQHRGNY